MTSRESFPTERSSRDPAPHYSALAYRTATDSPLGAFRVGFIAISVLPGRG